MAATKTAPRKTALRPDVAEQALQDAQARKAALIMRGSVTGDEWGRAIHEEEAAALALAEAERLERGRAEAERLAAIEQIKAEVAKHTDPADVIAALALITEGITQFYAVAGPVRARRITEWITRLKALDVPDTRGRISDEHAGVGWTWSSYRYPSGAVLLPGRGVQSIPPDDALSAAVADACRAMGISPGVFNIHWLQNVTAEQWIRAHF